MIDNDAITGIRNAVALSVLFWAAIVWLVMS